MPPAAASHRKREAVTQGSKTSNTSPPSESAAVAIDAPSLAQLYRRYAGWLTAILRKRYGAEAADDLVQETYLRLAPYQAAHEIRHPRALLAQVASNLARDQHRRNSAAARTIGALAVDHPMGEPASAADQLETLLYKQILLGMPRGYRDVYVLNRFGGLTYAEIANHCGLSVKAVEWRMSQALAYCAKHLRD